MQGVRFMMGLCFVVFTMTTACAEISPPKLPAAKTPKDLQQTSSKPAAPEATQLPKIAPPLIPVLTKRDKVKNLYRIKLEWKEATKAAVFFYRDVGYLVFNKPGKLSPGTFPRGYFKAIDIIPHNDALIVKFKLKSPNDLLLDRLGDEWIMMVGPMQNEMPAHLYPLEILPDNDRKALRATNDENEPLIHFSDPDTGDHFLVQPDQERGVLTLIETLYVDWVPTYQGVVALLKRPGNITVQLDSKENITHFSLASQRPLSSVDERVFERNPASVHSLVDLTKYDVPFDNIFDIGRMMRKDLALEMDPEQQRTKQIELAKLYLATGQFYEAAGVLNLLKERHSSYFYAQDELILMTDLAQSLAHLVDDDGFLSNQGDFEGEPERALLLAIQNQRFGRYDQALTKYVTSYRFMQNLPGPLRNTIALKAFEAGVEAGFKKPLFEAIIDKHILTTREKDVFNYYKAQVQGLINPHAPLRETYTKLTFSSNAKVALLARLALIDKRNMAQKSVIKDLESMAFSWRGDVLEQRFLATLAGLYQKAGEGEDALRCLRTIASYLWKFERSHIYTKAAEDLFYKSFMAMKDQPLLKQIGYYYEFEDITPRGERYGHVIERLSDLYMQAGLSNLAIGALKQRAKYLNFEKKRRTLSTVEHRHLMNLTHKRIAELHFIAGRYDVALKNLDAIRAPKGESLEALESSEFIQNNTFLRAKAYFNLSQNGAALEAIKGDNSLRAQRLRADVYMLEKRWDEAIPVLGELLAASKDEKFSGDFDVDAILDLAVVASHLDNQDMLEALRSDYSDRIADPEKKQAFDIILSSARPVEISKAKIAEQLAEATRYGDIMGGIKKDILETKWRGEVPATDATTATDAKGGGATASHSAPSSPTADDTIASAQAALDDDTPKSSDSNDSTKKG